LNPEEGIVKILKQEGTEFLSVMPIGNITREASHEKLRLIMMRTERFAVGLADGYSRASNGKRIGVVNLQGGAFPVGPEIAAGAVAQAFEDSSPILGIMNGPTLGQLGQNRFDITRQYSGITKWTAYIPESRRIPEVMRRAFTYLRTGRRGPVILHCSGGTAGNWDDYDEAKYPYEPVKGWRCIGDPRDVEVAVRALLASSRPTLYAGQGVFYAEAWDELVEFAELVQVPVVTTLLAKSVFPEDHPLSAGVSGLPAEHYLGGADLVFGIGESFSPGDFKHYFDGTGKTIIQADVDERDINTRYKVDCAIIGDAKLILQQLIEEVKRQRGPRRKNEKLIDELASLRAKKLHNYKQAIESDEKPINPYRVYWDLMNTIDRKSSVVTHDAGNTRDQLRTIYEAIIPRGFIGWGNASSLGFGLSAAAGAKLAYPERTCIHITGDAGFMYQVGNFESLLRENIAITTMHINNSAFGGYGPGFWGPGHNPETSVVTSSAVLNTSRMAEGLGEHAERIEEPDEIVPAIKRAIVVNQSGKPAFLEFICSQYPIYDGWMHA
jgi:thiamine pyrophosphate-dependent acetolactate synthase large subunit-like protein